MSCHLRLQPGITEKREKMDKKNFAFLIALIFILILDVMAYSPDLSLKWVQDINGIPNEVHVDDLNNDGSIEFVFILNNGIYAVDSKGYLVWRYDLDNILAVSIADINNDFYKEVVISSGEIAENIARGSITSLSRDGKILWKFPSGRVRSTTLMHDIQAFDIDNNKYYEIIGGSVYGISVLKDTYDEFLWQKKIEDNIKRIEIAEIVTGIRYIIANSFSGLYILDLNGTLLWNYRIDGGINTISIGNFYGDEKTDILITSKDGRIYILGSDGKLEFETATVKGISAISTADFGGSYERVFLVSDGILYALNPRFQTSWEYAAGKERTEIYVIDLNKGGKNEILAIAGDKIYEIDEDGNLYWEYNPGMDIDKLTLADIDNDNYDEFIINSGSKAYAFNINRTYINKQKADFYYTSAYVYFNSGDYENATIYLENAIILYSGLKDIGDVIKSRLLSLRIGAELKARNITKIKLADAYYRNAENYYNDSDYKNAKKYIERAIGLYLEINNERGISKSNALLLKIDDAMRKTEITTTTTTLAETPREKPKQDIYGKFVLFGIPVLLAIILIFIILRIRK